MPLVELKDVTYTYPDNRFGLRGINAAVHDGEMVAVIGPNGSGKSTLARLMCGILVPEKGRVLVDGLDTGTIGIKEEIRKRAGLVLQNPDNQLVASRVEEDIAFGPENLNLPSAEVRRRVEDAMHKTSLVHLRERPPHLLSGGEKQRLAIAGLLALRTSCLVLDEPTAMLDPGGRSEVLRVIRNLTGDGVVVILITHHMDEAALADRIWVLDRGKLVATGKPGVILENVEMLSGLGLDTTKSVKLARLLEKHGINVPAGILTMKDMVCYICRAFKQRS